MLLGILLAVLMVVCVALIGVILLQRSEGGAFGMSGGGPGAFMTARGTGDFLSRTTEILVGCFFGLCLLMTIISGHERAQTALVQKMKGLPTISSAPPVPSPAAGSSAPAAPGAPLGARPTTAAPNFAPPPINLLGNTPNTRPAPARAAKAAKDQPHIVAPEESNSLTPPVVGQPSVAPAPVKLPPPVPGNSQ
jgi:preprotein translocase subunit SecG